MAVSTLKTDYVPYTTLNNRISYWRRNGVVGVRLTTDNTVLTSSGVFLGTLPVGFRPSIDCDFAGTGLGGSASVFFRVATNGEVHGYSNVNTQYWSGTFSFTPL